MDGSSAVRLHAVYFRNLRCGFLQLDELTASIRGDEKLTYVWTAIDARTKIMPEFHVGRRFVKDAYSFVHRLKQRLAKKHVPVFASDGLRHYFSALTAHFGHYVAPQPGKRAPRWQIDTCLLFGMLCKIKVHRKLKDVYTRIRCGTHAAWLRQLKSLGFSGKIQTAYIERSNLTVRAMSAMMARRTWPLARSVETLATNLEWMRCYYHFCRPHLSLVTAAHPKCTPAIAAGLACSVWSVERVLRYRLL